MKKLFTIIILFVAIMTTVHAQLTISATSFPNVGDVFTHANDTSHTVSPGTTGTNQTWDYSALQNIFQDTSTFVSVASTPYASSFPSANLAVLTGGNYAYLNKTATEIDMIGLAGDPGIGQVVAVNFTSPAIDAKSGVTYNSNYGYTSNFSISIPYSGQPPADSIRVHQTSIVTKNFNGWGSVISPTGTWPCLRLYERDSNITVIDAHIPILGWQNAVVTQQQTTVSYYYIDNVSTDPIVTIDMDTTSSTPLDENYRLIYPAGITNSNKPTLFTVYPNPSSSTNINLLIGGLKASDYFISIYDITGKQIFSEPYFVNETSVTNIELNSLQLASGSYIATVSSKENETLQSIKFEISK